MSTPFLSSYRLDITPLSPLHLGTGETYDPTGYVIESGTLFAFSSEDALSVCTAKDREALLSVVSRRDPVAVLRGVQQFFFALRERLIARSTHVVPVRPASEQFYLRRVGNETNPGVTNLLDIERTAYDLATGRPFLPGSGIKGAIRTALLDLANSGAAAQLGENSAALQQRLFGYSAGKFELDPMRLVQVGDARLQGEAGLAATEIRFAVNRKKKRILKDGAVLPSQAENLSQVLETVRPFMPRAFQARLNLQLGAGLDRNHPDKPPRQDRGWSAADIARACHRFYRAHLERELTVLKDRNYVDDKWAKILEGILGSAPRRQQIEQGRAFLLRVGRHCGAESVTLNGVRKIKIMEGGPRPPSYRSEAKTLWLAAEDPKASGNLLPFGWLLVEVAPEGSDPPPWHESFDAYHQPDEPKRTGIPDPFHERLRTFKDRERHLLSQLLKDIESRPDREECLRLLGARVFALYGTDKKQLKTLREKFPALAPYLAKR